MNESVTIAQQPPGRVHRTVVEPKAKIAYIMSRFPKITETFILNEILAVEQQGMQVEIYPLLRERTTVIHPQAVSLVRRAHFHPFLSWRVLCAQVHFLRRKPRVYLGTLWTLLRTNWGNFRFFTRALGIFPKTAYFALLMDDEGISHVHAHFASHPAAAAFVVHRLVGIPYSFTAHGSDLHRNRHMLREKVTEAEFVVPISNYNRQIILAECGDEYREKLVVVHCGVNTQIFQRRFKTNGQSLDPYKIFCIGTLHEVKGQTYLIEACRLLWQRGISFTCHLVGDGPDLARLTHQAARAGLADHVQFHGWRTGEEIAELLQTADVVVAPSVPSKDGRREGIPVVLMEAMSSGIPVVASAISGIPELVEDRNSGLLVAPGDAATLADALETIRIDRALRLRLSRAGRQKVVREFDLCKNAAALAQRFYHEPDARS